MRTDDLIAALAASAGPAPRALAARRLVPALLAGIAASSVLAALTLGVLPDLRAVGGALWVKLGYAGALAASAGWLASKLGRPASPTSTAMAAVGAVLVAMALAGTGSLLVTPAAERMPELMGQSWTRCPWAVLGLSLPTLAAAFWALRGLAPTRPRAAGLAAGLAAGGAGAFGYAFACIEPSTAFVAVWYSLGIGMAGVLGALLGPRLLRW